MHFAGAAVAAGLGPLAIGTDGGGSVRIPASFNGLVALKATYGRVPNWPPTLNGDFSNTGPMARTARDCALMMNAIARPALVRHFHRIAWLAVALTAIVVVFGSFVRLSDAGLSCPDWPTCYGRATWPSASCNR